MHSAPLHYHKFRLIIHDRFYVYPLAFSTLLRAKNFQWNVKNAHFVRPKIMTQLSRISMDRKLNVKKKNIKNIIQKLNKFRVNNGKLHHFFFIISLRDFLFSLIFIYHENLCSVTVAMLTREESELDESLTLTLRTNATKSLSMCRWQLTKHLQ